MRSTWGVYPPVAVRHTTPQYWIISLLSRGTHCAHSTTLCCWSAREFHRWYWQNKQTPSTIRHSVQLRQYKTYPVAVSLLHIQAGQLLAANQEGVSSTPSTKTTTVWLLLSKACNKGLKLGSTSERIILTTPPWLFPFCIRDRPMDVNELLEAKSKQKKSTGRILDKPEWGNATTFICKLFIRKTFTLGKYWT